MKHISILVLTLIFVLPESSDAQLLGRIKRAAQNKIEQKVADRVVEEVSNEIARQAMKPINKAFDDYLKAQYESETGEEFDQAKFDSVMTAMGSGYTAFIEGMNKSANVPDQYIFDITLEVETQEQSKEKTISHLMFSKADGTLGFHQTEDGEDMLIVMDPKNDVMVMFNQKENTGQAIPALFSATRSLAKVYVDEEDYVLTNFEETGKTKKIAGYQSKQYKGETNESKFTAYFSDGLPFDWTEVFGDFLMSISPRIYNDHYDKMEGMMMQSEEYDKETKKKSKWEVKKVSETTKTILKSDYKFPGVEG